MAVVDERSRSALRSCLLGYSARARDLTRSAAKARKAGLLEEAVLLERTVARLWDAHANELLNPEPRK